MTKKSSWVLFKLLPLVVLTSGILMATPTLLELQVTSGASTSGVQSSPTGFLFYSGAVGNWYVNDSIGTTTGVITTNPIITSSGSAEATASSPASLTLEVSAVGFTGDLTGAQNLLSLESISRQLSTGTASFEVFYGNTDGFFQDSGTLVGPTTPTAGSPFALSNVGPLSPSGSPYSLTLVATLTNTANGATTNFNMSESVVPEPGFYGVLALALGGLLLAVQRRRKVVAKV